MGLSKWIDIEGFEGKYQINRNGVVRALWRSNQYGRSYRKHILRQVVGRDGYCRVYLTKNGKTRCYLVHRLVAQAFIPNPNNFPQINHKSEVKTENTAENLEWCDGKYNMRYGTRLERWRKQVSKPIKQMTKDGKTVAIWDSAADVNKKIGYDASSIRAVVRGKRKSAYGYVWKSYSDPAKFLKVLEEVFDDDN